MWNHVFVELKYFKDEHQKLSSSDTFDFLLIKDAVGLSFCIGNIDVIPNHLLHDTLRIFV